MLPHRLRDLHVLARIGLTAFLGVVGLGLWASMQHLADHYEKRDGRAGLTIDDITAAYRGIDAPSPLAESLEGGHPESLEPAERAALLRWLRSDRITEEYDSLDLGDDAPAEIIARQCLSCHGRSATPPADQRQALELPLDYWDDVQALAFARDVPPTPRQIVVMSLHAHALTMSIIGILAWAMATASAWPRWATGGLAAVAGLGLLADLSSWLLAPVWAPAILVIVGGGAAFNIATALLLAMAAIELWRPRGRSAAP